MDPGFVRKRSTFGCGDCDFRWDGRSRGPGVDRVGYVGWSFGGILRGS